MTRQPPEAAALSWRGEAFNQEPDSANEIHGDALARQYGFSGGLVPGVTISAYLLHSAVQAWGEDFLRRGWSHVRVVSPLYDREHFTVEVENAAADAYTARLLRPDGTVSAHAQVRLEDAPAAAPVPRGDTVVELDYQGPAATREYWMELAQHGCRAQRFQWRPRGRMGTYLRDEQAMPALLRGPDARANAAFLLGISNWITAANAAMNPWVHLETRAQHYRPVCAGTDILAEMEVADVFDRGGHGFVDTRVNLFDAADRGCLCSIALRAIYRLRGAGQAREACA